jgi:hypothetical protein
LSLSTGEWLLKLRTELVSALSSGLPAKDPIWKAVAATLETPPPMSAGDDTEETALVREDLVGG